MKIGYHTLSWANCPDHYEITEIVRQIKEIGAEGIEFVEPLSRLGEADVLIKLLRDSGLRAVSLSCDLNMEPDDKNDIEEVRRRVEFAGAVGVKDVMLCGGWLSERVKKEESFYRILTEKLDQCCDHASDLDMNIAFHPHKNTIVENKKDIEKLLELTDKPKLCLDIAHLAACGSDPAEAIRSFKGRTTYIHLKDWDSGKEDFVELGRGSVDIAGCAAALRETGYHGWAVVELDRTERSPQESGRISLEYLRKAGII